MYLSTIFFYNFISICIIMYFSIIVIQAQNTKKNQNISICIINVFLYNYFAWYAYV